MPPPLALGLSILLIGYLIRRDRSVAPRPSPAVWIPIFWLIFSGSRQPSQWFGMRYGTQIQALTEGSSFDQLFYGALIVAGIFVLANRHVRISQLTKNSSWIILFFLYEGLSCVWADFPFISFRRWIKGSGDFVMVFVVLSDPYPVRAITAAIKRSGYIMIPLSVLLIKYYREWGMAYDDWGHSFYTGVTLDKNMFGYLLFAYGLFFATGLVCAFRQEGSVRATRRKDLTCYALLLAMVAWLTPLANSKTSLISLVVGIAMVVGLQFARVKRHLWFFLIAAVLIAMIGDALFSVKGAVLEASGRNESLTGRTEIWQIVLNEPINPLLGTGYMSFWLGERLHRIWTLLPRTPILEAHNGYIEVYLNLGLVGVALLGGVLWTGLRKVRRRLSAVHSATGNLDDSLFEIFGLAYTLAYLMYNITEATFQGVNFLFIIFLLLAFDFQRIRSHAGVSSMEKQTVAERALT